MNADKVHQSWVSAYLQCRAAYCAITLFLLLTVGIAQDSVARDFVLLFGILSLGGIHLFQIFVVRQIMAGFLRPQRRPRE